VVVAAGITLHEALAAYEELRKNGIHIAVVDLYCVKPLNATKLLTVARNAKNRILTVEDHYLAGGIGEAVCTALINEVMCLICMREWREG
jgi:transketolase